MKKRMLQLKKQQGREEQKERAESGENGILDIQQKDMYWEKQKPPLS